MGDTKIADVIVPELFTPYVLNKLPKSLHYGSLALLGI